MNPKAFCISWRDFSSHLGSTFQELVTEGQFADVTLVSDDQHQIQVHKIVLSAGSHVLKKILTSNPHSHPLIYLKGVKQRELYSILQFMYCGEATINQDSINEFMENAKDMEVKDLIYETQTEKEMNAGKHHEIDVSGIPHNIKSNNVVSANPEEQNMKKENINEDIEDVYDDEMPSKDEITSSNGVTISCDKCPYWSKYKAQLQKHQLNVHEGVSYACSECDVKYTEQKSLKLHQLAKHEGVRYSCDECDYSSSRTDTLRNHKSAKHKIGPKYFCNQCDFQATLPRQLKIHKQGKHEGLRYSCNHCEFKALRQDHLALHKQSKHERN